MVYSFAVIISCCRTYCKAESVYRLKAVGLDHASEAKAVIRLRFLPDEGKAWRDAHPEYKNPLVPAAVYESMLEHYIIVKCSVNLSEEIVWKGESEKTEVVLLGTTTLKRMVDAVYGEASLPNNHATYSECGNARMDAEADRSRWDETVYVYYHPKEDKTIMTNIEGDYSGVAGSSAGFEGKVRLSDLAK
jgi:hypothetical protein